MERLLIVFRDGDPLFPIRLIIVPLLWGCSLCSAKNERESLFCEGVFFSFYPKSSVSVLLDFVFSFLNLPPGPRKRGGLR